MYCAFGWLCSFSSRSNQRSIEGSTDECPAKEAPRKVTFERRVSQRDLVLTKGKTRIGQLSSERCNHLAGDVLQRIVLGTNVTLLRLASALPNGYVKSGASKSQGMLSLTDQKSGGCARWCALVVLIAIFALAISLATRYGSAEAASTSAVKTSHSYSSQPPGRQRLTKDAANWVPPTIDWVPLQAAARPARIPFVGSAIPNPSFASILYYRPPPISPSFS